MDYFKEFKKYFRMSDSLTQLIIINVAVFVIYHIIQLFYFLFAVLDRFTLYLWLAAPTDIHTLLARPWTLITYMFSHTGFFHLFFNMLCLYFFGRIFRLYFNRRLLVNVYILGGIVGVLLYIVSYNIFPVFAGVRNASAIIGASAGVSGIALAISCYVPRYRVNFLFFGGIKLIHIALFIIIMDIIYLSTSGNAGGHISHLGGALFGYLFAVNFQKGKDITGWFSTVCERIGNIFKPKPKMKVAYKRPPVDDMEYNRQKNMNQQEIDCILDKISKGGYDSLTQKEKETLFNQRN